MPSYPAKPYVVPYDSWFDNNSSNYKSNSKTNGSKSISTIHDFFYRQSDVKVGGSDKHIQIKLEKKSSKKIIISSLPNSDASFLSRSEETYSYSKIPTEFKSIKKRSFEGKKLYKNFSGKNLINFRRYLLNIKFVFFKIISRKKRG